MRINVREHKWRLLNKALVVTHAVLIPVLVVVSVGLILDALPVETVREFASWEYWRTLIGIA
jgi:hypothetical protein